MGASKSKHYAREDPGCCRRQATRDGPDNGIGRGQSQQINDGDDTLTALVPVGLESRYATEKFLREYRPSRGVKIQFADVERGQSQVRCVNQAANTGLAYTIKT